MLWKNLFPSKDSGSAGVNPFNSVSLSTFFRKNKWLILICVLALILLLFLFSENRTDPVADSSSDFQFCSETLRKELEQTLSEMSGVGKCTVFITYADGGETVYAYDEDTSTSDGKTDSKSKYVLVSSRSSGLILKVYCPSVLGVAVICQGGDSTRVKNDVTEVLSRTLGISADRISVKKMH